MKSYELYKESRTKWVSEVPNHWKRTRNKYFFTEINSAVGALWADYPLLSLTKKGIIYRDTDSGKGKYPASFENYKSVENGDLIFCLYDIEETPRTVGLSKLHGMITGSYKIYSCHDVNSYFIYYYYLTIDDFKGLKPYYTGLRNVIRPETFGGLTINLPLITEQSQIVSFLDSKTRKIDKLIELTKQKIELLKEQRTALINQCVTKGLNPNVEMKDSGVEWIGEIPKHWNITKLKFIGDVVIGLSYKPENVVDEGEGTLVMRSSNVQNGKPSFSDNVYVNCEISEKLTTKEGDILICSRNGSRRLIGKNCIITKEIAGMSFGVFMTIFRSEYWGFTHWILNSPIFKSQAGLFLTSTINQLTVSTLQNFIIPFIAERAEQNQIVEYLNEQTHKIDSTIEKESQRIELLKEYRRALISEVVTGKIDVRDEVVV
jgi:type I restriction enzyme, S subunit